MVASSMVLTNSTGARRGLLLTTSLASSLIMLDSNIVAVSLPTIARSLGATFDLALFEPRALWNVAHSRVEMHLESRVRQEVEVPRAQLTLTFERGERIWTESSYKYDAGAFETLLGRAGFVPITRWIDESRQFLLLLCELSGLIVSERVAIAISPAEEPPHR